MKKITLLLTLLIYLTLQINAQITTYPYLEEFESGPGGWVADNTTNGSWALGTPTAFVINSAASGSNSWVTNLIGNYSANTDASVTSPVFDFTSLNAPSIQLSVWWNCEFTYDGMVLGAEVLYLEILLELVYFQRLEVTGYYLHFLI